MFKFCSSEIYAVLYINIVFSSYKAFSHSFGNMSVVLELRILLYFPQNWEFLAKNIVEIFG